MTETQFKDTKGNIWTLDINIGQYLEVKNKFDIDLSEAFSNDNNWIAAIAAHENITVLLGIIDILTAKERESRDITLDQMYEGIDGDVVEHATEAFIEAVVNFLPAHKRKAMRIIVDSVKVGMRKVIERVEAKELDIEDLVETELKKLER